MKTLRIVAAILAVILSSGIMWTAQAGPPLQKCTIQPPETPATGPQRSPQPECGLELTCTDKPVLLGNSQGVCFRATCPGIWGLIHTRADQASFRRRFFRYRHYSFKGYWDLKDQGVVEAGAVPVRELFLVLPEDLIEFKVTDPDCYARIEMRKLGYIKTGNLCELQEWLAYNSYMEKARLNDNNQISDPVPYGSCLTSANWLDRARSATTGCFFSIGRTIGLPFVGY
ncbi:MAG: hypothetical protein HY912_24645 [Desulfomonile tiedjei]|uniref:YARHG domain-containing protein n=1 Tax=Desulfomonile tiedjei TaxID=2358 RepID=A0A9D6VC53_9BACT|nr:hypothetical protein [Desulfomonile tiedjei]